MMTLRFARARVLPFVAGALLVSVSTFVQAAPNSWSLMPAQSGLDIKLTDHRTTGDTLSHLRASPIAGTIDTAGNIDVPLSLNQLDIVSQLPPMLTQKALKHGMQHIQGHIDPTVLSVLQPGKHAISSVTLWEPAHRDDVHQHITTPIRLERSHDGIITVSTPSPVSVNISPLLQQDNASLIMSLLGYQRIDNSIQVTFQGILQPAL